MSNHSSSAAALPTVARAASTAVLLSLCAVSPAAAQDEGAGEEAFVIEEIVVTAQKREQSVNDIGIAIDVFTGRELERRRATKLTDIAFHSPNLSIHGPFGEYGYPEITIRGVNADNFTEISPQSAGVYVDGIYLSSPPLLAFQMLDVERVEVLKGPQGTLYGRNTVGGAVNFISRKPTFEPSGYVKAGYGRYQRSDFEGAFGGPISDTMAGRFSAKLIQQRGGPLFNTVTGEEGGEIDQIFWRGQLLIVPNDDLEVLLKVHGGNDNSDIWPFAQIAAASAPGGGPICPEFLAGSIEAANANCVDFQGYSDTDGDPYTNALSFFGSHDNQTVGISAQVVAGLGELTLTSVTGYDEFDRFEELDEDAGPFTIIDTVRTSDVRQFSQELRLSSDDADRLSWIGGLYYSEDTITGDPSFRSDFTEWFGAVIADFSELATDTWAVFGQADFALTDSVRLTAGLRYTSVERDYVYSEVFTPTGGPDFVTSLANDLEEEEWSGRLGIDFEPYDDLLLYASVSRGFNAGTFNAFFLSGPEAIEPTEAETVIAYEAGVKASLAGRRLQVNGSVFFYDYDDIQLTAVENRTGVEAPFLTNAEGATITGGELEVFWRPTDMLDFRLGVGFLDTELDTLRVLDLFGAVVDLEGGPLANSPELSFNGMGRVFFPVAEGLDFVVQADAKWEDEIPRDLLLTRALFTESHWLVNGRLSLESEEGWDVGLWVQNLTDEEYVTEGFQVVSAGMAGINWSYPRTYGVSFGYRF